MAWKESSVSEQRLVLAHRVVELRHSLSSVAREMGVSRKTAYKWVTRYRVDPMMSMVDRSRRPHRSPGRVDSSIEAQVLAWRDAHRWGPRKIHRCMRDASSSSSSSSSASSSSSSSSSSSALPSMRTVATILRRHGRIEPVTSSTDAPATQRFERGEPNELWQMDHKGPVEIARQRYTPLVVLDDHSRYCLSLHPTADKGMLTAWEHLWDLFGEVGLPEAILSDNAFSAAVGLSWMDARLVRLGIAPLHGRPYHPQTQGKVERLNGTINRELIDFGARCDCLANFCCDGERWRRTYNTIRPHESLGDEPPASRWKPSPRVRPTMLPDVSYPADAILRKVTQVGDVYYKGRRILVGRSLERQHVRLEERDHHVAVYYGWKPVRILSHDQLGPARSYKLI
jgi:transposase InsO family protein